MERACGPFFGLQAGAASVKTKIVYCKDANRRGDFPVISFDFLGFQFRARKTMWVNPDRHFRPRLHTRRQPESVKGHRPGNSAVVASSSQRQILGGPRREIQSRHSRLDRLLQQLLQDAIASDPQRIDPYVIWWARRKFKRIVIGPKARGTGLTGYAGRIPSSLPIGRYVMETAGHREPCESRGSCTVLGAPGGETPPGDSTFATGLSQ